MSPGHSISTFAVTDGSNVQYFELMANGFTPQDRLTPAAVAAAPVYRYAFASAPAARPRREAVEALASAMRRQPPDAQSESTIPAGYTYLLQFLVHDISHFALRTGIPKNQTSAALDMESVLGLVDNSAERQSENPSNAFRIGLTTNDYGTLPQSSDDVPRVPGYAGAVGPNGSSRGYPLIPDTRNEGFLQLNQMHVLFLKFFNSIARKTGFDTPRKFNKAVRIFRQHVQAVVLHDLLPRLVHPDIYSDVIEKRRRRLIHPRPVRPRDPFQIPLEFAFSAGRFGHAMVRERYDWNDTHKASRSARLLDLITHSHVNASPNHTRLKRLERDWIIAWRRFFDFSAVDGAPPPAMSNKIGTCLSDTMGQLPAHIAPRNLGPVSTVRFDVARTTLLRHVDLGISPAQAIISIYNLDRQDSPRIPVLHEDAIAGDPALPIHGAFTDYPELCTLTPLWFYILREAEYLEGGNRLGPLGGRILAETFLAAIEATDDNIVAPGSAWTPTLDRKDEERFTMVDLILYMETH